MGEVCIEFVESFVRFKLSLKFEAWISNGTEIIKSREKQLTL